MGVLDEINTAAAMAGHNDFLMEYKLYQNMPPLWRYVQGAISAKHFVLGLSLGGAVFLGIAYMFLLQTPCTIAPTIWMSTFLVPIIFSCGGYLFYAMAQEYDLDYSPGVQGMTKPKAIKFLAICIWVISGIVVGLIARLRQRIQQTISIARAAAESTKDVKETLVSPIVQFMGIHHVPFTVGLLLGLSSFYWESGRANIGNLWWYWDYFYILRILETNRQYVLVPCIHLSVDVGIHHLDGPHHPKYCLCRLVFHAGQGGRRRYVPSFVPVARYHQALWYCCFWFSCNRAYPAHSHPNHLDAKFYQDVQGRGLPHQPSNLFLSVLPLFAGAILQVC